MVTWRLFRLNPFKKASISLQKRSIFLFKESPWSPLVNLDSVKTDLVVTSETMALLITFEGSCNCFNVCAVAADSPAPEIRSLTFGASAEHKV